MTLVWDRCIVRLRALFQLSIIGMVITACGGPDDTLPGPVQVAVASNFAAAHQALEEEFERETRIRVETSLGSTGALYAQIINGAPYHIFLAADAERPRRLVVEHFAAPGSHRTFAIGRLVLYAPRWDSPPAGEGALRSQSFERLAIANADIAPYGAAAEEVLRGWGLLDTLADRIVRGGSVSQTLQFIESGAAEVGFVALSQVIGRNTERYWIVPDSLHQPIVQDAVLLARGATHQGAQVYFEFLRSDAARRMLSTFGYTIP